LNHFISENNKTKIIIEKVNLAITKSKNFNNVKVEKELIITHVGDLSLESLSLEKQADDILKRISEQYTDEDKTKEVFFNLIANKSRFANDLFNILIKHETVYNFLVDNKNMPLRECYTRELSFKWFLFIAMYGYEFANKERESYLEFVADSEPPLAF